MPKENKKRGRRAEAQKRKLDEADEYSNYEEGKEDQHLPAHKKQKTLDQNLYAAYEPLAYDEQSGGTPFYGLLDEQEQEYFKRADNMLELNQFDTPDERTLFLESVYKEADAKELKLACSQSSSRLLERLILLSNAAQLKKLFEKFSGHFLNLVQHRFASHCCETLFVQSALVVTEELLSPAVEPLDDSPNMEPIVHMEDLYLHAANELSGNIGFLMTDRFASHTLRVLLVVLSGEKMDVTTGSSVLRSKKKEHIEVVRSKTSDEIVQESRAVPEIFKSTLEMLIDESISGLDTHYLRTLATHQVANPMLQLLVQLELTRLGKQRAKESRSIIRTLLPDDPILEGTESASFINGLMYDTIGSRLLETIIVHAPGKMFKAMYKELFRERMGGFARNEIASYVASKILERLSHDDLEGAVNSILPQIPNLVERGRTAIIKTLIERCEVRGADTSALANILKTAYSSDGETLSISKLLSLPEDILVVKTQHLNRSESGNSVISDREHSPTEKPSSPIATSRSTAIPASQASKHASNLAQTMLLTPGPLSSMLFTAISLLPPHLCFHLAMSSTFSRILQTSLTVPHSPLIFRRKLITRFYSQIGLLSLDPSGSHVIDAIWKGTHGMAFARERVAEELAENESELRRSSYGRIVWRNWRMDLYRQRRGEWVRLMRESVGNEGFLSFPGGDRAARASHGSTNGQTKPPNLSTVPKRNAAGHSSSLSSNTVGGGGRNGPNGGEKSKLELARERYAHSRRQSSSTSKHARGANASVVTGHRSG